MSLVVPESRTSAKLQETHGVYHGQFENDWVRLVRVRYPANSTVPLHGHLPTVTTYIYLSDSSPVRFTHHGSRGDSGRADGGDRHDRRRPSAADCAGRGHDDRRRHPRERGLS